MNNTCSLDNESDTDSFLDTALANIGNNTMDQISFVPETPSPVFDRKQPTRSTVTVHSSSPELKKKKPYVLKLPSPLPSCSRSILPSQHRMKKTRNCAMNRLEQKRNKMHEKTSWLDSDSEDDFLDTKVQPILEKYDRDVLLESSDTESLDLCSFDVGGANDDDVRASDVVATGAVDAVPANCSSRVESDDSDISDAELEAFVNNLLLDTRKNTMHNSEDHNQDTNANTDHLKRKSNEKNNKSRKKRKSAPTPTRTSSMQTAASTEDSVIVVEDDDCNQDEPVSPTSVLNTLVNSRCPVRPKRNIMNYFGTSSSSRTKKNRVAPCTATNQTGSGSVVKEAAMSYIHQTAGPMMFPESTDEFLALPSRSPRRRNAKTVLETRTASARRRGNRNSISPGQGTANMSLFVSPSTRINNQLAEDETMARRLQEEMDREYAMSLYDKPETPMPAILPTLTHSPPRSTTRTSNSVLAATRAGRNSTPRQSLRGSDLDHDSHMMMMIQQMTDYERSLHQATLMGSELPESPSTVNRTVDEILNPEVLEYMSHHQHECNTNSNMTAAHSVNEQSPVRPSRHSLISPRSRHTRMNTRSGARPRATSTVAPAASTNEEMLDYETAMLMRIGGLTDQEWALHQNSFHRHDPDAENRFANRYFDQEIINFMEYRNNRQAYIPSTRRSTSRRGRRGRRAVGDYMTDSFDANDYESLLNLAESIGDAKPVGLTSQQVRMLPTKLYKLSEVCEDGLKECNVCLVDYEENDSLKILQCFHYYHTPCIDRWLKENASCPICRVKVQFD